MFLLLSNIVVRNHWKYFKWCSWKISSSLSFIITCILLLLKTVEHFIFSFYFRIITDTRLLWVLVIYVYSSTLIFLVFAWIKILNLHYLLHLQGPCESVATQTLSGRLVTGASGSTLAALQTALPKGPGRTRVLAVASNVACWTLTGTFHWVAVGTVLTLALLAAVQTPVLVVTGCKVTEKLM